jgi:hypothetical protein
MLPLESIAEQVSQDCQRTAGVITKAPCLYVCLCLGLASSRGKSGALSLRTQSGISSQFLFGGSAANP